MICIKEECGKSACASIAEDVLDVNSTDNKWVTDEPTFKKVTVYYCKEHFDLMMEQLANSKGIKY